MKLRLFAILNIFIFIAAKAQVPSNYYDSATGLTGNALMLELHNIISNGHTKLDYGDLWIAFASTDVFPAPDTTVIWDMYSDIPGGTPAYTYTLSTNQCGTYSGEGDCYNREHSFPKSWFGGDDSIAKPPYSDLNHLYATDGYVNSKRSNYPFGEVNAPTYTSSNGSKLGNNSYSADYSGIVFEPIDEYKGDFARTYFYMATRYKDEIPSWVSTYAGTTEIDVIFTATGEFTAWYLSMLLDWHEADPVSQKETDRNNEVYNEQGNANPYINHPEWACEVFASGTCSSVAPAQNFVAQAISATEISLSWNLNANSNNIVLAYNTSNTFGTPVNGTSYAANDPISGGGTVIYSGSATSFSHTSLSEGTTYYYRIWSLDGTATYSSAVSAQSGTLKAEPQNHATAFVSGAASENSISLSWTDATGTPSPDGYLIKASDIDYSSIVLPTDGLTEADNLLVKNISFGVESVNFTGLDANTTYYFQIFPYTNSGTQINYKTSAVIPQISVTTNENPVIPPAGCATSLFFSEYIEGSNFEKYLEIYNATGFDLDLTDYQVLLFTNGGTTATSTQSLSGTLANNQSYIIRNSAATLYTSGITSATANFNGNDAIVLKKISTGEYIDIFGRIGEDPGTTWEALTADKTLVRKWWVNGGITVNPVSGFPTVSTEWDVYNQDDVSHLASHEINCSQTHDLYISEYIEGSSNNKAIEITNYTDVTVNLADYQIWEGANGAVLPGVTLDLSGLLAPGESFVIANSSANAAILSLSDISTTSQTLQFNGDDVVALAHKLSDGFEAIDIIGVSGVDPGTGWAVAGISTATEGATLVRKPSTLNGNTDWASSAGTNTANSEWMVLASDYITDLGIHAKTFNWIGTTSDWQSAANWSIGREPGASATVDILSGYNEAMVSTNSSIYTAQIQPNAALTIESTANLTIADSLVLHSDINGNASLIESANLNIANGKRIELFLTDFGKEKAWHYFASPVESYSVSEFNATWLYRSDETTAWDMDNIYSPMAWKLNDLPAFQPMEGYAYKSADTLLVFEGNLHQGAYSRNLSYTDFATLDQKNEGWHLIGNPYTSSIDWDAVSGWTKTNIEPSIHFWNDELETYKYYNSLLGLEVNQASNIIPPMQAFYVKVNTTAGGTLSMNNDVRTHAFSSFYKFSSINQQYIRLELSNENSQNDECLIVNLDNELDNSLTQKIFNFQSPTPQIGLQNENNSFAIFAQKELFDSLYFLNCYFPSSGYYTLKISENKANLELNWMLTDYTNNQLIKLSDNEYTFYISKAGFFENIFSLSIKKNSEQLNDIHLYYENETLYFNGLMGSSYEIIDISGRIIQTIKNGEEKTYTSFSAKPGIYIFRYKSQGIYKTIKFVVK